MRLFVLPSLLLLLHRINCQIWNYEQLGPDVWSDTYPLCASRSQSPINIRTTCTTYQSFPTFRFSSAYNLTYDFTLTNNGHTIVGKYNGNGSTPLLLTGGGLDGTYEFRGFHLHWGENYKSGSEHQVNGIKYAGEIHFIHMNPQTNQTAVLGIFMQSTQTININDSITDEWTKYFTVAENLQQINNSTTLSLNVASLMGNNLNDFWRYEGSLTTPPCTEGIIWTVFKTPIMFTENELNSFRNKLFFDIHRGPQPLYRRMVYRNFLTEAVSSIWDDNCCSNNSAIGFSDQNSLLFVFFLCSFYFNEK